MRLKPPSQSEGAWRRASWITVGVWTALMTAPSEGATRPAGGNAAASLPAKHSAVEFRRRARRRARNYRQRARRRAAAAQVPLVTKADLVRAARYEPEFVRAGARFGVDPRLLWLIAWQETRFVSRDAAGHPRRSPRGATGLMQLMPATAARFGVDPTDDRASIHAAAAYLRFLLDRYHGDLAAALAAYNAGEASTDAYREGRRLILKSGKIINPHARRTTGGIPPYRETISYVARITELLKRFDPSTDATDVEVSRTPVARLAPPEGASEPATAAPAAQNILAGATDPAARATQSILASGPDARASQHFGGAPPAAAGALQGPPRASDPPEGPDGAPVSLVVGGTRRPPVKRLTAESDEHLTEAPTIKSRIVGRARGAPEAAGVKVAAVTPPPAATRYHQDIFSGARYLIAEEVVR